jgi:hypothetical protein
MTLDDKGRCCGRKPLVYRGRNTTSTGPHKYCPRCDRAYELEGNEQIPNWGWKQDSIGNWQRQSKTHEAT